MIPLTIAEEIRETLLDYLITTFNFQDQEVEQALLDFFLPKDKNASSQGLFKGPYISLRLPYRKADPELNLPIKIRPGFTPYAHQVKAFERLSAQNGHKPEPTLVTTGTGSGKTECFLYPILDYCYEHREEPGIKAIILYPMNALATDQSGRLAQILWNDERLNGQITAGIYIGGESSQPQTTMSPDHLIDDRITLRKRPPDILLTNYRMLDFLLLRPEDKTLWAENTSETLRFLVLDELHTYDGAQGSDVACLIRRLKARLNTPEGFLCPIGTSATVASEQGDTLQLLTEYAKLVFGEPFELESVIVEDRIDLESFLPSLAIYDSFPHNTDALREVVGENYDDYIKRQSIAWFGEFLNTQSLAKKLSEHSFLRAILTQLGNEINAINILIEKLSLWDPIFAEFSPLDQQLILQSFMALISHARVDEGESHRPFLTCQVQLWVREISRLMREVSAKPSFFWRDDIPISSDRRGLPAYFCRECGHTGWLSFMRDGDDYLQDDLKIIYPAYFNRSKNIRYVFPDTTNGQSDHNINVCPGCLSITDELYCKACEKNTIRINLYIETSIPQSSNQQPNDLQRCPLCGTDGSLSLVGSQAASLSSVAISQLYTTPLNQDKKLLAFTDSVQDASHRASFFEARTYRFNLRTAIQSVLNSDKPIQLIKLTDQVLEYWRKVWTGRKDREQHLVSTFMPPDLHDFSSYQEYMDISQKANEEGLPSITSIPNELEKDLKLRLSWELTMEYGFTAQVGRSLERVGSSVAFLDLGIIDKLAKELKLILTEELGIFDNLLVEDLQLFILGLLERTRVRGGVTHPLLKNYVYEQGNWYLLTKKIQPILSPFHKNSPRFPRFLTDSPDRSVFDPFISKSGRTWLVDWARKNLGENLEVSDINEIYRLVINHLSRGELLSKTTHGFSNAFGINAKKLWVTKDAVIIKCDVCGHQHTVAAKNLHLWANCACMSYRCRGKYTLITESSQHYYRDVYQRGQVERIFAHEHTGLISRKTREEVEKQFKLQTRADATNLLTATPTLELGIDIGDLSSTLACSVPPAATNYLQRIGRAGRKTGNSLILTLANAQPHDLYFFEEPLEMMAGTITPPGCYLDAPDMLKRQFLAFCMDTWTVNDPRVSLLPVNVQKMLAGYSKGGFPASLLTYFENNRQLLINRFIEIFDPEVSEENREILKGYYSGDALRSSVHRAIIEVDAEREELRTARKNLKTRRDKIEADQAQFKDPAVELKRLDQEMALLLDIIKQLENQYILNFFTDAGLLPNYAFPETGVRLVGVISDTSQNQQDGKNYKLKEYIRPASLAIREVAPFNRFYVEGHKLTISHIDIAGKEKAIEKWQFCDQCSHMELVQLSHYSAVCPNCGSTMWSDAGQTHNMVLFRKAMAYVEAHESRVGDEGDDREREYYQTRHFFEMEQENSRGAYLISTLPFGIEYMDQVTLREINFGFSDTISQKIKIGGEEFPEMGFRTCRDCGVNFETSHQPSNNKKIKHTRNCASATSAQDINWENIYLYRKVTSEAIRILLPVSTTMVEEKITTFEACLDLGLRKKFRGNPDHLHILNHTEPADDGSRRRYLVVYDSVPGGTGFLKDLAKPENFFEVLQLALDNTISCNCRLNPEKQACYRCLYSYKKQRDLRLISRQLGVELLNDILSKKDQLISVPSLTNIHIDDLLESELEQRLIFALDKFCKGRTDYKFTKIIFNGKQAWELLVGQTQWIIEPQVLFGPSQGVSSSSKADFVFWPQSTTNTKPVIVFTDGYAYHVKPEQSFGGIADDIKKRQSLIDSGKYLVWSIVWDEVSAFENERDVDVHFLSPDQSTFFDQTISAINNLFPKGFIKKNSVEQLIFFLRNPELINWQQFSSILTLALLRPIRPAIDEKVLLQKIEELKTAKSFPDLSIPQDSPLGDHLYNIQNRGANHIIAVVPKQAISSKNINEFSVTLRLEDHQANRITPTFKNDWLLFWKIENIFQFLPEFTFVSSEEINEEVYSPYYESLQQETSEDWSALFKFANTEVHSLLQHCQSEHKPIPIIGYELTNQDEKIVATAELAWEKQKIAILFPDQIEEKNEFKSYGWNVFYPEEYDQIIALLNQEVN